MDIQVLKLQEKKTHIPMAGVWNTGILEPMNPFLCRKVDTARDRAYLEASNIKSKSLTFFDKFFLFCLILWLRKIRLPSRSIIHHIKVIGNDLVDHGKDD